MVRIRPLTELDPADRDLVAAARRAAQQAYAPYSGFSVGAAVRTRGGAVHSGANLENASYGLSLCAEATAVAAANLAGGLDIEAVAVSGPSRITPCGRCRQIIAEAAHLTGGDVRVLCSDAAAGDVAEWTISELLPGAFGPADLSRAAG